MAKRITSIVLSAALLVSPVAVSTAFAQMGDLTMLEQSVSTELAKYGYAEYPVGGLTLSQLGEIKSVTEDSTGEANTQQRIDEILADPSDPQ